MASTLTTDYEKESRKRSVLDIDTDNECEFNLPSIDGDSDMHRDSELDDDSYYTGNKQSVYESCDHLDEEYESEYDASRDTMKSSGKNKKKKVNKKK